MGRASGVNSESAAAQRRAGASAQPAPLALPPRRQLQALVQRAVALALDGQFADADPLIRPAKDAGFDYQANVCLSLAKRVGENPRVLAQRVAARLSESELIDEVAVSGAGFLNLRISDEVLARCAEQALSDERLGVPRAQEPLITVVDYSSPNVAKEMHVGHLRSTVIGDALARTLEFQGHRVLRQNHLGDWGTQFGMLVQHMVETGETQAADFKRLTVLYRDARTRYNADPEFAQRARARVVSLQAGDEQTQRIWHGLVDLSREHMAAMYARLGVTLQDADVKGESFYNDRLQPTVDELMATGIAQQSEGASVIFSERHRGKDGNPVPLLIQKSGGGFGYDVTDMAALRHRLADLHGQRLIYVTDARQSQHFDMVFEAAGKAGWLPEDVSAEHVPFGMVLGEDGKPFKTRSGDTVALEDLLDEAVLRARAIIESKNPDMPEEVKDRVAEAVGIGAVKYMDLSSGRQRDYVFSFERMLSFDGNTGPYLQYAHVRAQSIAARAGAEGANAAHISVSEPAERALVLKALEFADAVDDTSARLEPHRICGYLYEVADAYSTFYENCPVLKASTPELRAGRLALCALTARTLEQGLGLLGIRTVEAM